MKEGEAAHFNGLIEKKVKKGKYYEVAKTKAEREIVKNVLNKSPPKGIKIKDINAFKGPLDGKVVLRVIKGKSIGDKKGFFRLNKEDPELPAFVTKENSIYYTNIAEKHYKEIKRQKNSPRLFIQLRAHEYSETILNYSPPCQKIDAKQSKINSHYTK